VNLRAVEARATTPGGWPEAWQDGRSLSAPLFYSLHWNIKLFSPLSFTGAGELIDSAVPK